MSKRQSEPLSIKVGARASNLSKCQLREVYEELKQYHPDVVFDPIYIQTVGDRDRATSLRNLDKTNFFTYEIDQMLLQGECRIAIHSAKDLPEPLPAGLELIALTRGVDPSDSLVMRAGESLLKGSVVATSSNRREERVRLLEPEIVCVDIRGTIEERLALLERGEVDGVVIAEAALIRLQLTFLNRIGLPGESAPLQGRLAVVAREGDEEMRALFHTISYFSNQI